MKSLATGLVCAVISFVLLSTLKVIVAKDTHPTRFHVTSYCGGRKIGEWSVPYGLRPKRGTSWLEWRDSEGREVHVRGESIVLVEEVRQ
jgi:hypothetical protein